ncbi:MAG: DegV family protein [Clostridia bacterium]|nr:DegV family protein [Clostridia bacterium]
MGIKIIVDSTADIKKELQKKVTVVPLTVNFGDKEYIDGVTIGRREFYEKLIESDVMPTTSQATPDSFMRCFEAAVTGGDEVICITLSQKLSGTYQSATIAASEFKNKVFVVDSESVAIGMGILVELALRLVEEGRLSAKEIYEKLLTERENICIVAMLDTLEYLKRGGRISKTVAFAGGLLSIKPVIGFIKGEIVILGKARGSKHANNLLAEEIEKKGGIDFSKPLLLGYTGLSDALLIKYIEDSAHIWEGHRERLDYTVIGSVVGTHAGPGAVAAAFFKK